MRIMLDLAKTQRHEPNAIVFEEGAPADLFFLLLDGTIRVTKTSAAGDQVTSLHIPAGQLFGIGEALGHKNYPATAMAASEILALSWPTSCWTDFVSDSPSFGKETYKTVGGRISEMNTRIFELSKMHVEQRVARSLLRLASQSGRVTEIGIEVDFPITRHDISEMTGTTLHTVSRLLSSWEKDGVIVSKRKKITIRDNLRLRALGEQ